MSAPPVPTAPSARRLRSTARVMLAFPEPESWLDVGTGVAEFPDAAREFFPYTAFDGVDTHPGIEWAWRTERLEEAYLGHLADPRLTARLRARYDVVSMLHHLPRTPDPRAELRAALTVLRPGGLLLVEGTHPHGTLTRDGLRAELESQGCTIVATGRRAAHIPLDLSTALSGALPRALPPWLSAPLLSATRALDRTLALALVPTRFSKTYRLIARKNAPAPAVPTELPAQALPAPPPPPRPPAPPTAPPPPQAPPAPTAPSSPQGQAHPKTPAPAKKATPARKAASAKKVASPKRPASPKKATSAKEATPAKKATSPKRLAPAKKTAPPKTPDPPQTPPMPQTSPVPPAPPAAQPSQDASAP
ncbi:methyltransferase domain-containing protein [Streptomyces sp. YU58]|uniref:methyltransferase domain-containing protein n=1 Tax=Streptomyces sp. SX92 TaxID=3158972 RepID=UPI0027B8E3A1|nr:methyltransferase domain-containing protein [Streptomyces coralus]WLW55661.1 methyltransferase domain-containing protein [Streptomyces coralus]